MASSSIQWRRHGNTVVSCAGAGALSDDSVTSLVEELGKPGTSYYFAAAVGMVTVSSKQRQTLVNVIKEKDIESVAIVDHAIVRGVVTAVSWFGVKISAYAWTDLESAAGKLKVSSDTKAKILESVNELRQRVARTSMAG